jgi:hypothetical protein
MNMEMGSEATQFPEKEYIKGIFVPMRSDRIILPDPYLQPFLPNVKINYAIPRKFQFDVKILKITTPRH